MAVPRIPDADFGVIVGRFQVPALHAAHCEILDYVCARHKRVLVLLGIAAVPGTPEDPLDYLSRKRMIQEAYPQVFVEALKDVPNDDALWSKNLDHIVSTIFPLGTSLLYGGRDSFAPFYSGSHPVVELSTSISMSGTQIREDIRKGFPQTAEAREGAIWATTNRYPHSIGTVDVVPYRFDPEPQILLARRANSQRWRMIGGFVDPGKDPSLEAAARRECREETSSIAIADPEYMLSRLVDDPRYASAQDKIMTAVFVARYLWGAPKGADDIEETRWFSLERPAFPLADEHLDMIRTVEKILSERYHVEKQLHSQNGQLQGQSLPTD